MGLLAARLYGLRHVRVGVCLLSFAPAAYAGADGACGHRDEAPCPAQPATPTRDEHEAPGAHTGLSVAIGLGHSYGIFGVQVSLPVVIAPRLSVGPVVGAGAFPALEEAEGHWAFAGGIVVYWGRSHRLLLEVSISPIAARTLNLHGTVVATELGYGPGAMVGYEFIAASGFLMRSGVGAGVILGNDSQVVPLLSGGIGWKW